MHKKIFKILISESFGLLEWLVETLPNTVFGNKIRMFYWKKKMGNHRLRYIGRHASIDNQSGMDLGSDFILGDFAALAIADSAPVFIGNNVGMARGTFLRSANHASDDVLSPILCQGHTSKKIEFQGKIYSIVIEDNVWFGANSIILTGAHIGTGSIISAGSVVSFEVPPYSIVVGNPGRVMANRLKLAKLKTENGENKNG
jgi:acetyltransferase-like isoleucine patch superfamily enzyme